MSIWNELVDESLYSDEQLSLLHELRYELFITRENLSEIEVFIVMGALCAMSGADAITQFERCAECYRTFKQQSSNDKKVEAMLTSASFVYQTYFLFGMGYYKILESRCNK